MQVNNNHNENSKLSCNLEVQTNSISEQISISKLSNNLNEIITVETNFNDAINKSTSNDCLESTKPLKYNNDDYLTPPQNRIINNLSPISTRIMNNLYGEIWITTPGLLKKTSRKLAIDENKKHLDFDEEDLNEKLTKLNISNNRDKDFEPLFNYESDSEGNKASNEGSPDVIKFVKKHTRKIISSSSDSSEDECEKLKNNIRAEIDNDYQIPKAKTILTYDLTSTSRPPAITNEKKIKKQFKPKTLGNIGKVSVINNQEDTDLDQKNNQYYSFMASLAGN